MNGRFRLFVIDHDFASYLDISLDDILVKPVLFVTNPPVFHHTLSHP